MLTTETKRKIDNARDILVGKIPIPMSQIEQITIALIYKFMSDIDEQNKELGGESFFYGDFEKYSWKNLMDKRIGAQERLNLYAEGLKMMTKNERIPELFRNIFRNAYLPFRDPQVLDRFLKQIDEFTYDHSEDLGDAFEYLLSTAGSQGDAGQFRTPRHIIDFIVSVVNPTKDDTILDPACGTAGFLISAYKWILEQNKDKKPGDKLSILEREKLHKNFVGYDISHEMVRLSLVNMYLHNFANPKIYEYDTLSDDRRWNDEYSCILANPPFMTPKGGIKPHDKFSIKAKKSEVLFVDYIMEHLTINGKAGIIVPEGIIFQSANAYKELRKKMIQQNFLYAVISLPSGVFQPYSGVKTSILLFDKKLAKKTDKILFVKIENDGFDLGVQRRPIDKNDLPKAREIVENYKLGIMNDKFNIEEFIKSLDDEWKKKVLIVEKSKIAESGDYNLSMERYRVNEEDIKRQILSSISKISEDFTKNIEQITKTTNLLINSSIWKELNGTTKKLTLQVNEMMKPFKEMNEKFKQFQEEQKDLLERFVKAIKESVNTGYEMVELGEVCEIVKDKPQFFEGEKRYYSTGSITDQNSVDNYELVSYENKPSRANLLPGLNDIGFARMKNTNKVVYIDDKYNGAIFSTGFAFLRAQEKINPKFLYYLVKSKNFQDIKDNLAVDGIMGGIRQSDILKIKIPLPALEIQKQIVEELDAYQKIIDGAKQVVENYKPHIDIDPSWEMVELGEVISLEYGKPLKKENRVHGEYPVFGSNGIVGYHNSYLVKGPFIIVGRKGSAGKVVYSEKNGYPIDTTFYVKLKGNYDLKYIYFILKQSNLDKVNTQAGVPGLNRNDAYKIKIPFPSLEVQKQIVEKIEEEQKLVEANKKLIEIFEKKIEERVKRVWEG